MSKYITINHNSSSQVKSWILFLAKTFTDAQTTLREITFLMGCKTQLRSLYALPAELVGINMEKTKIHSFLQFLSAFISTAHYSTTSLTVGRMGKSIESDQKSWWTFSHLCCYHCWKGERQLVLYPLPETCQKCAEGSIQTLTIMLKHGSHMHRVEVFSLSWLSSSTLSLELQSDLWRGFDR